MLRLLARLLLLASLTACAHPHTPLDDIHADGFSLPTVDGQQFALADARGRVVLLSFFATWCFPCVAESEVLRKVQAAHPQDLTVVGVGMDLDGERVLKPYRDEMQISYPVLIADEPTRKGESPFGAIRVLPTTFVLDRQGAVRDAFTGVPDEVALERSLQDLLSR